MPGAVFTIPDGRVMDAATYLIWDNLGEYLVMGKEAGLSWRKAGSFTWKDASVKPTALESSDGYI